MKSLFCTLVFAACLLFISVSVSAQKVNVSLSQELKSGNAKAVADLIDGDDNTFYTIRFRNETKGNFLIAEKFEKTKLTSLGVKEVTLGKDVIKINNVLYAQNNIYVFTTSQLKNKTTLECQKISFINGDKINLKTLVTVDSVRANDIDFFINGNMSKTRFLIATSYIPVHDSIFYTKFIAIDPLKMDLVWTKSARERFSGPGFLGLYLDNNENIFYARTDSMDNKMSKIGIFPGPPRIATSLALDVNFHREFAFPLEKGVYATDICFYETEKNELLLSGFVLNGIYDEGTAPGNGIYAIRIDNGISMDVNNFFFKSTVVKMFDLEVSNSSIENKKPNEDKYKMEEIIKASDHYFLLGQKYKVEKSNKKDSVRNFYSNFEYKNIVVTRLDLKTGSIDWIKSIPCRISIESIDPVRTFSGLSTGKGIAIFYDENMLNKSAESDVVRTDRKIEAMNINSESSLHAGIVGVKSDIKIEFVMHNEYNPIQRFLTSYDPFYQEKKLDFFVAHGNELIQYRKESGTERLIKLTIKD
jgi:hypothetical protein